MGKETAWGREEMNFRLGFVLFTTCIGAAANADVRTLVRAVETSTAFMNVPTTDNSRLTFKPCDECEFIEVRLTPATQYFLGGEQLPFAEFRTKFMGLRRSKQDYALVTFNAESSTVTSVRVSD
jgi:hypothetical protein